MTHVISPLGLKPQSACNATPRDCSLALHRDQRAPWEVLQPKNVGGWSVDPSTLPNSLAKWPTSQQSWGTLKSMKGHFSFIKMLK